MNALGVAVLAAVCASAAIGVGAQECDRPFAVGLRLHVDRAITPRRFRGALKDAFEDEAARIWEPYGVELEWSDDPAGADGGNGFGLDVRLQPRIEQPRRAPWAVVLGSATVQLDAPTRRPIFVSVDETESMLALGAINRTGYARNVRDVQLARGLGRVLAHEIGHVLLGAPRHTESGLMRASFRPDELGQPDRTPFRLTPTDVARLQGRLQVLTADQRFARR